MNERIKELAKQANIEFTYDPTETPMRAFVECWEDDLEKFAELIVGECVRKIEDIAESNNDPQPIYRVAVELLEHFGVEE